MECVISIGDEASADLFECSTTEIKWNIANDNDNDDEYHGDDDLFERCTVETKSVEVKPQIDVAHDRHNGPKVDQHLKILLSISDI